MASSNPSVFPPPSSNQTYVSVSPIPGGYITLSDSHFVHPADPGAKRTVPSLTFLIQHPGTTLHGGNPSNDRKTFNLMFDLGLRKAANRYPAPLQNHLSNREPYDLQPGVAAQLEEAGLSPEKDIDLVILSHVHYDHHGDPEDFPSARFMVGHGALDVLKHGLGGKASHQHFEPDTLPHDRSFEFSDPRVLREDGGEWFPLGPFPAALDLFRDGSVFVIDCPGHLPGHVNLLCRTREKWVLLAGDAFHDRRLLTGEKDIGTWEAPGGGGERLCIHLDKEAAAESIGRLRKLLRNEGERVEIVAAHEEIWWEKNKHKQFPGTM